MVFVPGGAFTYGSASPHQYGCDFLMSGGVILVTLNYRVGAPGIYDDFHILLHESFIIILQYNQFSYNTELTMEMVVLYPFNYYSLCMLFHL